MREGWRWFGPDDPISLGMIKQAGATEIVSALHDLPAGIAWSQSRVHERAEIIREAGLTWRVVESLSVSEEIKLGTAQRELHIAAYIESLEAIAESDPEAICYNFMPVVDWTRTELAHEADNGALALRFDCAQFAAYDCFVLARPGAEGDYSPEVLSRAEKLLKQMTLQEIEALEQNIIAGLPGGHARLDRVSFVAMLGRYAELGQEGLRANLDHFLSAILPVSERLGLRLCIHPDDPPFSLFGLPRIVSTKGDLARLLAAHPSPANGITLCAGSLGSSHSNDLLDIARTFASRVQFAHLRNVRVDDDGSFAETDHLEGDNDLVGLIEILLSEGIRRSAGATSEPQIVFRPDHGLLLDAEAAREDARPGYSYLGRLRGLAELRGVIAGLSFAKATQPACGIESTQATL